MSKFISFVLLLLISSIWLSCKKVDIRFGEQFLDNGYTQIVKVDTFNADLATIRVDSFPSSATGVSLIGSYDDPYFGRITSQCYSEMIPPFFQGPYTNSTFDSVCLIMVPNRVFYGDSTQPVQINVHKVTQIINGYEADPMRISNTREFPVDPVPLGSASVLVNPLRRDSIKIKLSDAFGNELLDKLKDPNDKDMLAPDAFIKYFNGIRVSTNGNGSFAFGCKDSLVIRVYYKQSQLFLESKKYDISIGARFHHYNQITVNRSGAVLQDLNTQSEIPSSQTGNAAYTSYVGGAMARVRFNSIRDIPKLPNYTKILRATLIVRPLRGSYSPMFALPPLLRMASTNVNNQIGFDLFFINNGNAITQYGNLTLDYLYGENTNYFYDVTDYVSTLVKEPTLSNPGMLMLPPSPLMETSFNRIAVGNRFNNNGKTELVIVYAAVK
ncbi:MAG: DUF4270 family protein [Bacteroidota bacterium]